MSGDTLLELQSVTKRFGGLTAVDALSLSVRRGTVHGLIGPNGAGKSTAFDLISGLQRPTGGRIFLEGSDISGASVQQRVACGICRTFQTPRLFEAMTALEVVMTGAHIHGRMGMLRSTFLLGAKRREETRLREAAEALLDKVGIAAEGNTVVANLSYGNRRLLEIARALATRPRLLLLDEVASGLNPVETAGVARLIETLASEGLTIVVVEHDMPFVMGLSDEVTVLNFGARIASGPPAAVSAEPAVVQAYLGTPHGDRQPYREQRATGRHAPAGEPSSRTTV